MLHDGSTCAPCPGGTCADGLRVVGSITLTDVPLSKASCGEPLEINTSTVAPLATLDPAAGTVPATCPTGTVASCLTGWGVSPSCESWERAAFASVGSVGITIGPVP